MSTYTTELRYILESYAGLDASTEYPSVNTVIEKARTKLFSFNYPIFDKDYKEHLESLICLHFYRREIGFETVGLFKLYLEQKMREIMPFYNQLYKSELLEFNPFYDVDLTRDHKLKHNAEEKSVNESSNKSNSSENFNNSTAVKSNDNTVQGVSSRDEGKSSSKNNSNAKNSTNANSSSKNKQRYSDTPQGSITDLEKDKYLTNATINDASVKDTSNATSSDVSTGSEESTNTHTSNTGTENKHEESNNSKSTKTNTLTNNLTDSGNRKSDSLDDYLEHVKGKQGSTSYASLLKEYRETFLNIDLQVIGELNTLFMLLW